MRHHMPFLRAYLSEEDMIVFEGLTEEQLANIARNNLACNMDIRPHEISDCETAPSTAQVAARLHALTARVEALEMREGL